MLFDRLHYSPAERAEVIEDAEGDWIELANYLRAEVEESKGTSQPKPPSAEREIMASVA